ncbi:predicted protein [Streptomyces viridosporus ATCC 14672]|uniref:Predicted protein n=1 Tax=Streptomyces viridosporus (strain ATCC 14672 / DSM 40746 / JCM 4963 / KCTC 9882 / NRRL B-12104 / FH 1290) TaxID=566461 RepID=D6A2C7_STRV1|nr:predicted protein [Streptomyces viridosporus ATCC 14672]
MGDGVIATPSRQDEAVHFRHLWVCSVCDLSPTVGHKFITLQVCRVI